MRVASVALDPFEQQVIVDEIMAQLEGRRTLRKIDTPEGLRLWAALERAASRCPQWIVDRLKKDDGV